MRHSLRRRYLVLIAAGFAGTAILAEDRSSNPPVPETAVSAAAYEVFRALAGSWRFESRPGPGGGEGFVGTREYRFLYDSLKLEWDEVIGDSTSLGHGVLGFDVPAGRFYYLGVYEGTAGPTFLVGDLDPDELILTFEPVEFPLGVNSGNRGLMRSRCRLSGQRDLRTNHEHLRPGARGLPL